MYDAEKFALAFPFISCSD